MLRQEDLKFVSSMGYILRPPLLGNKGWVGEPAWRVKVLAVNSVTGV